MKLAWLPRLLPIAFVLAPATGLAQGGPPLVTDDPGTPGNRRWEINLAFTFEKRGAERTFETPLLDVNYGLGDRIQLKVEIPWIVSRKEGVAARDGLGNTLLGVKWRFLDEETAGVSVSTYPQIEINTIRSSARRGLVEQKTGFLLPFSVEKALGPISANVEVGYALRSGGDGQWIYGLALGRELSEHLEIAAEVFGGASLHLTDIGSAWNVGCRWKVAKGFVLLVSAGAGIAGTSIEPRARFQSYAALQLIF